MQTLSAWVLHTYTDMGRPSRVNFIELGPGRGTLTRQILDGLVRMPGGAEALRAMDIRFVEVSAPLRRAQHDALKCSATVLASEVCFRPLTSILQMNIQHSSIILFSAN